MCKFGSTPRLLGISFKNPSKILCEVRSSFCTNHPFNTSLKLPNRNFDHQRQTTRTFRVKIGLSVLAIVALFICNSPIPSMNNMKLYPYPTLPFPVFCSLTTKTSFTSRLRLIQLQWVSSGFSTAVNTRSGRAMKSSARPVSSPSLNSFRSLQRITGAFSASERMPLGDRRRPASSRWRTFQISRFLDF